MIQARAVLALSVVVIDEETGAVVGLDGCSKLVYCSSKELDTKRFLVLQTSLSQ